MYDDINCYDRSRDKILNLASEVKLQNVSVLLQQATLALRLHKQSLKAVGVVVHHRAVNAAHREN